MAYFNHAFKKGFLCGDSTGGGAIAHVIDDDATQTQTLATDADGPELAIVSDTLQGAVAPWTALAPATIAASTNGMFYIVQSSFHDSDTIGNNPGHGGYMETTKSKGINPKYITKMWKSCCVDLSPAVLTMSTTCDCFPCGKDAFFRLDVKGTPALRFLNHNAYHIADLGGICCADGQDFIDPVLVLLTWADSLNNSAIVNPFIQIEVNEFIAGVDQGVVDLATYVPSTDPCAAGAEVTGVITITGAYVESKFGNCSFDTRDAYNKAPVSIGGSVVDETGDPCNVECITYTATNSVPESTMANGCQGQTQGETVLRDILMTENYMQNPYNQGNADSARIREIEGSNDVLANIDRLVNYKQWNILHNVPRFNNPSGVFDNDQYLITISALCTDTVTETDIDALFASITTLSGVVVEEDQC
jgi:hypothetical protein